MDPADLKLSLSRQDDGGHIVVAEYTAPGSVVSATLAQQRGLRLDPAALLAHSHDLEAYGLALGRMLFGERPLGEALRRARAAAEAGGAALRLRLVLDPDDAPLHALRWEALRDPADGTPLAVGERHAMARVPASADLSPLQPALVGDLRAAVAVASPRDLGSYGLASLQIEVELSRACGALAGLSPEPLARTTRRPATLARIAALLREGVQILYLMAHSSLQDGETYLWLEREDGSAHRVAGAELLTLVAGLRQRPLLIVLASCATAGAAHDSGMAALGPQLARAGVAAVIAAHGSLGQQTATLMLPVLMRQLLRDGRADTALAAARAAALAAGDEEWWRLVLYLRPPDGRLWVAGSSAQGPGSPSFRPYLERLAAQAPDDGLDLLAPRVRLVTPEALELTPDGGAAESAEPLATLLARRRRLLLVGSAGGGKSWMLRRLAREMAAQLLGQADASESGLPEALRGRLPVLIRLGDWHDPGASLLELMQAALARHPAVVQQLEQLLRSGQAALFLDGVDGIPQLQRDEASGLVMDPRLGAIVALGERPEWQGTLCVVSCWPGDATPALAWPRVELLPLSRAQVEQGAAVLLRERPELTAQFLAAFYGAGQATGPLHDLAATPAGLRLLLDHFQREGRLPQQAAELTHALVGSAAHEELYAGRLEPAELEELYGRLGSLALELAAAGLEATERARAALWSAAGQGRPTETRRFWRQAQAVGQVALSGGQVRFTSPATRDYFAARGLIAALRRDELQARLATPRLGAAWAIARWLDGEIVGLLSGQLQQRSVEPRRAAAAVLALIPDPAATEPLALALGDADHGVRHHAARALAQLGDLRAVPRLLAALRSPEAAVRREGALLLGRLQAPVSGRALVGLLTSDPVAEVRAAAASALGGFGAEAPVPLLEAALLDEHARVRAAAAVALGAIGDSAAVGALLETLVRDMLPVAGAAARALARLGEPALRPLLALLAADATTAARAALALGHLRDPRALPALVELLGEASEPLAEALHGALRAIGDPALFALVGAVGAPSAALRRGAADALGALGDQRAAPHLVHALDDPDEGVAVAAGAALVRLGPAGAPALAQLLADGNAAASRRAALALGRLGAGGLFHLEQGIGQARAEVRAASAAGVAQAASAGGEGVRRRAALLLGKALYDMDAAVRAEAIRGLGMLGDERALPQLAAALAAPDAGQACFAAEALGQLGDLRAAAPLAGALHHPAPAVRATAARALGGLHQAAPQGRRGLLASALVPLLVALDDAEDEVRQAALAALRAIGATPAARALPEELRHTALPALHVALGQQDAAVRAGAAELAGALGDARAGPALLAALDDGDAAVRAAAAQSLGQLQLPAADALVTHLDDPSPIARRAALTALLQTPGAAQTAVARLAGAGRQQRWLLTQLLTALGPAALPELIDGLAGPPQVALLAATALQPHRDLLALAGELAAAHGEDQWQRAVAGLDAGRLQQLVLLLRHHEPAVRSAAAALLRRVGALHTTGRG